MSKALGFTIQIVLSGCGAVGSALALGACRAVIAEILRKTRKAFNGADFRHFKKTQKCVDFAFDHSLSHFHAKTIKNRIKRGVAQLGARDIWDVEAAGSNPVTPTTKMT